MKIRSKLVLWAMALLAGPTFGQTAGMLSFQGLIKDDLGNPVNGTVNLEFRIYNAESGGSQVDLNGDGVVNGLDTLSVPGVFAVDGILATKFGPIHPSAFDGSDRWLDVRVNGSPLSRVEMVTAPAAAEQMNQPGTGNVVIDIDDASGKVAIGGAVDPGGETFQVTGNARINTKLFTSAIVGLSPLDFENGGSIRMRIEDDGQVGIGTTSPNSQLHINGDGVDPSLRVQVTGSSKLTVAANGGVTIGAFQNSPPADGLYVNGNVGIGTSAPGSHDLAVVGSGTGVSGATFNVENTNAGSGIAANFESNGSDSTVVIGNSGTGDILRGFSSAQPCCPLIQVTHAGWLGLGQTTSPSYPIEVGDGGGDGAGAHLKVDGQWTDGLVKRSARNFPKLEKRDILERVSSLPITRWQTERGPIDRQHIGPIAEDFNAAFGTGSDDPRRISKIDAHGVALAAIQGMYELVQEQDRQIEDLRTEIAKLREIIDALTESGGGGR
jgi:hypothetical protein